MEVEIPGGQLAALRLQADRLARCSEGLSCALTAWQQNVWRAVSRAHSLGIVSEARYQAALQDIRDTADTWPKIRPYMRMMSEGYQHVEFNEVDQVIMEATEE